MATTPTAAPAAATTPTVMAIDGSDLMGDT
jgi:hypothetical protein